MRTVKNKYKLQSIKKKLIHIFIFIYLFITVMIIITKTTFMYILINSKCTKL